MKDYKTIILAFMVVLTLFLFSKAVWPDEPPTFLVKSRELAHTDMHAFNASKAGEGLKILRQIKKLHIVKISTANFSLLKEFEWSERDFKIYIGPKPAGGFGKQWALEPSKVNGVNAKEAWKLSKGKDVIVAVIDSGVDVGHQDLAENMWVNPNETLNGLDDDGDGYVDDINGVDFTRTWGSPFDDNGHGTHCAGIIAGMGIGAFGIAPQAKIMALKFLTADGYGDVSGAVEAVVYAVSHGASIISNSYGSPEYSQALAEAIAYAESKGILFVAAAGNESRSIDWWPSYPAAHTNKNVVAVASHGKDGYRSSFSNYGKNVLISAPGAEIYSTFPGGDYVSFSGTSMATPYVAGAAALIKAYRPKFMAPQIKAALIKGLVLSTKKLKILDASVALKKVKTTQVDSFQE